LGLTPANGIRPNFMLAQKFLADSNNLNIILNINPEEWRRMGNLKICEKEILQEKAMSPQ
ncbi:MAG: hypothetical protein K2M13_01870, partial [Muribaculaceae bacterium]|nr:hypothetical protein [Muribaculaceae bacterium]